MKLKTKFVLGSLFILVIFSLSSLLVYQFLLKGILLSFEEREVFNRVEQLKTYIGVEKENLLNLTRDWAAWSEAYFFLKGQNPNFLKVNLTVESWTNNRFSVLLYIDQKGNPVAGGFYDEKYKKVTSVDKAWAYEHFSIFKELYPELESQTGYVGLSFYKELPCIVAIHSVTTSDFKAKPVGFLITTRLISFKTLELWKKLFGFQEVKIVKVSEEKKESLKIFQREYFYEGKVFLDGFKKGSFLSVYFQIFRIVPLEDYFLKLIYFQIAILLLFFLILFFYFKEFLVEKFLNLVKQIDELKNEKIKRIEFKDKDEIAIIAHEINQLYEKVKAQIKEIEEAKKIYEIIAEKANMLIALLDQNKKIIYFNPLAKKCLTSETLEKIFAQYQMERDSQFQICYFNGTSLQVEVIPIKEYSNYYLLIGYDVTAFKEKIDQLFEISVRDFLTGVYNRRYLEEILKKLHSLVTRGEEYTVLFIDLDDLKKINDTFGHLTGDKVLKEVAKIISRSVRESDWIGRWGGDEFLVVIKGSVKEAKIIAERILENIQNLRFFFKEKELNISVSIGIAFLKEEHAIEDTIRLADKMAYEAKRAGKGSIKVANSPNL